jgi:hypothetical protein
MLQAMKEEPSLSSKCKDKFLIQSTIITPDKESLPLQDIWGSTDTSEETKVHQQKLKVVYLPAEGQIDEEDEGHVGVSAMTAGGESRFDTVRQHPQTNGHTAPETTMPEFSYNYDEPVSTILPPNLHADQPRSMLPTHHEEPLRPLTPPADYNLTREDSQEDHQQNGHLGSVNVTVHPPPPREPSPAPAIRMPEPQPDYEMQNKLQEAQSEIERLRALLAQVPPSEAPETEVRTEVRRRRNRVVSDDGGSTIAETDYGTMVDHEPLHQDGVPLQVVVIIALGVFITTYLFF